MEYRFNIGEKFYIPRNIILPSKKDPIFSGVKRYHDYWENRWEGGEVSIYHHKHNYDGKRIIYYFSKAGNIDKTTYGMFEMDLLYVVKNPTKVLTEDMML